MGLWGQGFLKNITEVIKLLNGPISYFWVSEQVLENSSVKSEQDCI
jgi:hypothetical protein